MARTITNYASVDYRSGNQTETVLSNAAQTTIRQTIGITKDAFEQTYRIGDTLTYVIQIASTVDSPTTVTVFDDLGSYTEGGTVYTPLSYEGYLLYVGQNLNPALGGVTVAVTTEANGVRFVLSDLPAVFPGLTLVVQAKVNEFAPVDLAVSDIVNTATLIVGGTEVAQDSATVTRDSYADVSILKSITPDPFTAGTPLSYTFVICNYGTTAPEEITLRDLFSPAPQIPLSVTVNDVVVDAFDYDAQTGQFVLGSGATEAYQLPLGAATYTRNAQTGAVTVEPAKVTVVVSGIVRV